jgi:hypothetical protein
MSLLNRTLRPLTPTEYIVLVDGEVHAHILYCDPRGHGEQWYVTNSNHETFSLYAFDDIKAAGEYATFQHVRKVLSDIPLDELSLDDLKALLRAQEWEHTWLSQQDGIGVAAQLGRFSAKYIKPVRDAIKEKEQA